MTELDLVSGLETWNQRVTPLWGFPPSVQSLPAEAGCQLHFAGYLHHWHSGWHSLMEMAVAVVVVVGALLHIVGSTASVALALKFK